MTDSLTALPLLVALYVRESTDAQLDGVRFNSLDSQESYLRDWLQREFPGAEVYRVYSDVESGTSMRGRSGLEELLHDARRKQFQIAAAYDIDRWSRSTRDYVTIKAALADVGVRFISATLRIDDTPEGELMEGQMAGFAQYFSRLVGRKVRIKRKEMVRNGLFPGGSRAFGLGTEEGRLVPDPVEAPQVVAMFEMFVQERSIAIVRDRLRAMGYRNRQGKEWTTTSLAYLLRNRIYIGELTNGEDVHPGHHPGIVDKDLFDAAQAVLPTKRRAVSKMNRVYPLLGVLHCGHCGKQMTSHYVARTDRKRPYEVAYYRCTETFKRGWAACPIKQVNAQKIERDVEALLEELAAHPERVTESVEIANRTQDHRLGPLQEQATALHDRDRELDVQIGNLMDVLKASGVGKLAVVQEELERLSADQKLVRHEARQVRQQLGELRRAKVDPERAARVVSDLRLLYDAATADERRQLIQLVFQRIEYRGPGEPISVAFFDRDGVYLPPEGSRLSTAWLQSLDSNQGPGD